MEVSALSPNEYTWVKDIKAEGYQTYFIGKWSVNPIHGPEKYGFDSSVGTKEYQTFREKKYPQAIYQGKWMGEIDSIPYQENISSWLAERAIERREIERLED